MVIGHEAAGTVIETGSQVNTCQVGDHVALEPGVSCGQCQLCKTGRYNLCPDMKFFATPPVHGSLANQVRASGNMVVCGGEVYICSCTFVCVYLYVFAHMYACMYVRISVCMYTHLCLHVDVHSHNCLGLTRVCTGKDSCLHI